MLQTPSRSFKPVRASEFHLTESGLRSAALTVASAASVDEFSSPAPTARASVQGSPLSSQVSLHGGTGRRWINGSGRQMAANGRKAPRSSSVARSRSALVVFAATILAA